MIVTVEYGRNSQRGGIGWEYQQMPYLNKKIQCYIDATRLYL